MIRLSADAERNTEKFFEVRGEVETLFDLIVAEFESDPMSVQCFDLRIVERAKTANRELKRLKKELGHF
jgi:hypothetical protein